MRPAARLRLRVRAALEAQFPEQTAAELTQGGSKFGKLTVLPVRMNPDLAMGDELLKKTGAGNLFMVFGEPDVKIDRPKDGKVTVEIRGVDVFDPTTGAGPLRRHRRHRLLVHRHRLQRRELLRPPRLLHGRNDPYRQLRQALRADIDEAAWETLYRTRSRPFDPPKTGKIAVKVINHYGDEVLKMYAL